MCIIYCHLAQINHEWQNNVIKMYISICLCGIIEVLKLGYERQIQLDLDI